MVYCNFSAIIFVIRVDQSLLTSHYYKIPCMSRNFSCIRVVPCTNPNLCTITVLVHNEIYKDAII